MNLILYAGICIGFSSLLTKTADVYSKGNEWGYKENEWFKGPSQWKKLKNATCNGQRQSPIDILPRYTIYWSDLKPIIFTHTNKSDDFVTIDKHPTSVYISFNSIWKISFGRKGCLKPVALHWHWGSNNMVGSEHKINGTAFPIEGHLVNYDCKLYSSFKEAKSAPSGLHVIGFFYEIGKPNIALNKVIESIKFVENSTKFSINITEIPPRDFLPKELVKYYRYEGSLTTPPCTENVIWTVLRNYQSISESQLSVLRSLLFDYPEKGPMVNNFRPTRPMLKPTDYVMRVVFSSFDHGSTVVVNFTLSAALLLLKFIIFSDI